jgi:hypothetical protein
MRRELTQTGLAQTKSECWLQPVPHYHTFLSGGAPDLQDECRARIRVFSDSKPQDVSNGVPKALGVVHCGGEMRPKIVCSCLAGNAGNAGKAGDSTLT